MLMMRVIFPFLLLICSARAREGIISTNQLDAAGGNSEDASAEGRACGGCGGGTHHEPTHSTVHTKPDIHDLIDGAHDHLEGAHDHLEEIDWHHILLSGLGALPVLAFNILGLVLLALLLKKLLIDDTGATATDPVYYSAPSSYAEPLTYHRRSSQAVTDAIDKYNVIDTN